MLKPRLVTSAVAFGLAAMVGLVLPHDASADDIAQYDGSWVAPHTTVFLDSSTLEDAQSDKSGTSLNSTIGEHWDDGECTYDEDTGEPDDDCDALRYGLVLYRGPDDGGSCPDLYNYAIPPQEDGGQYLTEDEKYEGEKYKVSQLQSQDGDLYCSNTALRPMSDVMYDYRDERFSELGTYWPEDPQLNYHLIKTLPQADDGDHDDQVRKSLEAACELYEGDGGQHLSMPTWAMSSPNATEDAQLYAGMLAAAGGTGQCCYDANSANNCDPQEDAIDMCEHIYDSDAAGDHDEQRLRQDIDDERYVCDRGEDAHEMGGMRGGSQSEMKCHLQGSSCDEDDYPSNLWPLFSCIQMRPSDIEPDDLAIHFCSDDLDDEFDEDTLDEYGYRDYDRYDEECISLDEENGGIEFVDDDKNMFYPTIDGTKLCELVAEKEGWTQIICPNEGELCDLEDEGECALGRYECINERDVCEPFEGNNDCNSSACAGEQTHETTNVQPNVQFTVDRSGSMNSNGRWDSARRVNKRLAEWSYNDEGCEDDGRYCDKTHMGVHFWGGHSYNQDGDKEVESISAQEDIDEDDVQDAYDDLGPSGGTEFHRAARLLANEDELKDEETSNFGIFVTDGIAIHAITAREAARRFCDLKSRSSAPITTYAVGFQGGQQNLNSLMAAAGGTGSCCFSDDGSCDGQAEVSVCDMYDYEKDHGTEIVEEFENFLDDHSSDQNKDEWDDLTDGYKNAERTADAYDAGTVPEDLDMVDDAARYMLHKQEGLNPENLDCNADSGDKDSSDPVEFLTWTICQTQQTLSYVVRQRYDGSLAKDVSSWNDLHAIYQQDDQSSFTHHGITCSGSKYADNENELYEELQNVLDSVACTYPLSLLDGDDSAPEYPESTRVKMYMPELGKVVRVPHHEDEDAREDFVDELCDAGIEDCESYGDDGWTFTNTDRTAVELSSNLCDFTKEETVEKVTTQVCRVCDPEQEGDSCNWVECNPESNTIEDGVGYTEDGVQCRRVDHPCPDNPDETCRSWAKQGRCGMGEYACDDDGLPYCDQVRSAMPEICNGVDDDCDGNVDDLEENLEQWDEDEWDLSGEEYEGWYCGYDNSCRCPDGEADSIGGRIADGDDEFDKMLEHQQENGECQCGSKLGDDRMTRYEPTATSGSSSNAACSSSGGTSLGLGAAIAGLLFGLLGWRRRREE
ncbi:MAG: hypothetical protein ACOCV2_03880 [Persicimonas sp.]